VFTAVEDELLILGENIKGKFGRARDDDASGSNRGQIVGGHQEFGTLGGFRGANRFLECAAPIDVRL